jgi:hypothetical protein
MSNNEANNTGTTSLTLTSETTVEPLLDEIENESTIDTTVVSEVKDWTEKMRLLEPTFEGVGDKLLCLIDNLPKTNATMGQGMTKTRILKFLVSQKYLQSENKLANLSYGRLNGTKKLLFLEYIETISRIKDGEDQNNCMQRFIHLKNVVLVPFEQFLNANNANTVTVALENAEDLHNNCKFNDYALLHHLIINPSAEDILSQIWDQVGSHDRPAMLDRTVTQKEWIYGKYEELREIAEDIKDELDTGTKYCANHCGEDAERALILIDPSKGSLKDYSGKQLRTLHIKFLNEVDTLIQRLDVSGGGVSGVERRAKAFDSFIGPHGRSKNISVYYAFLTWEDMVVRFTTRRLENGRSSSDDNIRDDDSITLSSTKLSKKQKVEIEKFKILAQNLGSQNKASPKIAEEFEKKKIELMDLKVRNVRENLLSDAMSRPHFKELTEEQQKSLRDAWVKNLQNL